MSTSESDRTRFSEEERVKILLQEYATLRAEILTRTSNLYQLIAVGAVLFVWVMAQPLSTRFWLALAGALIVLSWFYWLIARDIGKAAKRLRELEQDINRRTGETLLVWETRWSGAVTGLWGRGKPLARPEKRSEQD